MQGTSPRATMNYVETGTGKRRRLIVVNDPPSPAQTSLPSDSQAVEAAGVAPLVSSPLQSVPVTAPTVNPPLVANNNHNSTYAPGGIVFNYNPAETHIHMRDAHSDELDSVEKALSQLHVPRAAFDAAPSSAGCMEGTRVKLLADCTAILNERGGAHIVWIAGMAGTGKTSIALTLCRLLYEEPTIILGGTFFCSRSAAAAELTDARRIVPTLATVLARTLPEYACTLAAELEADRDLAHKSTRAQVERLLAKPLGGLELAGRQIVFVVDALDECTNEETVTELINAVADFKMPAPVKFLITSRPDMHIRKTPISDTSLSSIVQLHMVDDKLVAADIRLYIRRTLEKHSPSVWYTEDDLDGLVSLCGRLFISASTALAYILRRKDAPSRRERLKTVNQQVSTSIIATAPLDKMYLLVLEQALDPHTFEPIELKEIRRILAAILSTWAPLTTKALAELLEIPLDHLRGVLDELHAVIFVPEDDDEGELRTLHASFGDFIYFRAPEVLRIKQSLGHDELAQGCLQRMTVDDLCFNVSRSESSYRENTRSKPVWIARSLTYACLHWAHHVDHASVRSAYANEIDSILRLKLLFWLEVLSVIGEVGRASGILRIAASVVRSHDFFLFLRDANSFVTSSHEAIERSAPHIYLSALTFAPRDSLVRQNFSPFLTGLPSIETFGIDRDEGRCVMVFVGHYNTVMDIVYSSDGTFIASGSDDGTVRLWDARSGAELRTLFTSDDEKVNSITLSPDGHRLIAGTESGSMLVWTIKTGRLLPPTPKRHTETIRAVAISPDGKIVASASDDNTVGLWTISNDQLTGIQATGDLLCGHTSYVCAVAFSPDDRLLASCGYDHTIRFWDYRQGKPTGEPLKGHRKPVFSIAFSNDGELLASGSEDTTVRVWVVQTGQQHRVYLGHQGWVTSVAFAPHSCRIASTSDDRTVRVWDVTDSRQAALLVLRGHSEPVYTICFSNDGRHVASGSDDRTIRVWDIDGSRTTCLPLDGHTDEVHAVAVSRDGLLFASASKDGSARVWNAQSCEQMYPPLLGHEGPVRSIAISSDGRRIFTASEDTTLRIWDAETGQIAGSKLCGHTDNVNVVALSPDDLHLASGSNDHTIRVWTASTEQLAQIPQLELDQPVSSMAYSIDGQQVAVCEAGGDIRIFDAAGRPTQFLEGSYGSVKSSDSLVFSHDGVRVIAGAGKNIADITVLTGDQELYDPGHTDWVNTVAYSPSGRLVASGADDWTIRLWDLNTANAREPALHGHAGDVLSAKFCSDGRFLVTGSSDRTIRLWDLAKTWALQGDDKTPLNSLALARYDEEGWLVSPSKEQEGWSVSLCEEQLVSWKVSPSTGLLLWVPPEYRGYLEISGHSRVIATHRVVVTAEDGVIYQGEEWTRCWRPPTSVTVAS